MIKDIINHILKKPIINRITYDTVNFKQPSKDITINKSVINDILFTDYFEIDEKEELVKQGDSYFDNWKLHSDYLSQQNVYKINEKQTLELR